MKARPLVELYALVDVEGVKVEIHVPPRPYSNFTRGLMVCDVARHLKKHCRDLLRTVPAGHRLVMDCRGLYPNVSTRVGAPGLDEFLPAIGEPMRDPSQAQDDKTS